MRTELARVVMVGRVIRFGGGGFGGEVLGETNVGRAWSGSGGGVGGNMLRLTGGSDCCRDLLWRPGFTRLEAANEMLSRGRSSLLVSIVLLASEPAKPVKVFP